MPRSTLPVRAIEGAIDCDVHPSVPGVKALLPYIEEHWRDHLDYRGIDDIDFTFGMRRAPFACRPDWRPETGKPGATAEQVSTHVLDGLGSSIAILNPLWGAQSMFDGGMAHALCRAVNDWIAREWLDRESRLRASIIVPIEHPHLAAEEIERCAGDPRFVQVLVLAMNEAPLGRPQYWPILAAAERAGLPIGIHAGTSYRNPPTSIGWPSHHIEDYASQTAGFQSQIASLLYEGAFGKFPDLKVVLHESGVAWLAPFIWRQNKTWRGMRMEVPWIKEPPSDILKRHIRMTVAPFYGPNGQEETRVMLDQIDADHMLLFASDYPRWHFDGSDAAPASFSEELRRRMMVDNPLETYARLKAA